MKKYIANMTFFSLQNELRFFSYNMLYIKKCKILSVSFKYV